MQPDNSLITFFDLSFFLSERNFSFSSNTLKKGYFYLKCDSFDDIGFEK